jgi:hypothetical protein
MLSTADVEAVVRNADALLELHERIVGRLQQVEAEIGWQTGKARTEDLQERKVRKAAGRVARIFVDEVSLVVYRRPRKAVKLIGDPDSSPTLRSTASSVLATAKLSTSFEPWQDDPSGMPTSDNALRELGRAARETKLHSPLN